MLHRWYVKQNGGETGPYSWGEMQYLARCNKLSPEQPIRRSDSTEWVVAASVSGLFQPAAAPSIALETTFTPLQSAAPKQAATPQASPNIRSLAPPDLPPPLPKAIPRRRIAAALGGVAFAALLLLLALWSALPQAAVVDADNQSRGEASGGEGGGPSAAARDETGDGKGTGEETREKAASASDEPNGELVEAARSDQPDELNEAPTPADKLAAPSVISAVPPSPSIMHGGQATSSEATTRVPPPRTAAVIRPLEDDSSAADGEGNGGGASSGPSSQFFQIRAKGRSFAYVVDCSASMTGEPFEKAREELLASIKALKSNQKFFVTFFSSQTYPQFFPVLDFRLLPANSANKQRATEWVQSMAARGGTDPLDAILRALELEPDAIYLLSDGEFDPEVADEVRQRNGDRIPIHTIAFMDPVAQPLLEQIARENKGVFRYVP